MRSLGLLGLCVKNPTTIVFVRPIFTIGRSITFPACWYTAAVDTTFKFT